MNNSKLSLKLKSFLLNPAPYFSQGQILKYKQQLSHKIAPYSLLDDKYYLQYRYYKDLRQKLNLKNPTSFTEKLQWIKLFDRNPLYTQLADKYAVREYVIAKIGNEYLNGLLAVYEHPSDIDWCALPSKFVIKVSHGSQFNIICSDKGLLNSEQAVKDLDQWLSLNFYFKNREWPYKHIKPRIICEAYLDGDPIWGLMDYKFLCFNGQPKLIHLHVGRFVDHRVSFFDLDWHLQPFNVTGIKDIEDQIPVPKNFKKMLEIANHLSEGIPYCSVDLYNQEGRITFGEITFTMAGGYRQFIPHIYNRIIGDWIILPEKSNR